MSPARIIVIGNEVLSGEVEDKNIHFLTRRLTGLGTRVSMVLVVPDEDQAIVDGIRALRPGRGPILLSGGIGPTHDDRTRAAVAHSLGVPLAINPEAEECLRSGYGPGITPAELSMAWLPQGSRVVRGRRTGVIGFSIQEVYVFPGVPELLADVFETVAEEFLGHPDHRLEILTKRKEGDFAEPLRAIQADYPDVAIGSYPMRSPEGWRVRLVLKGQNRDRLEEVATRVRATLDSAHRDP